MTDSASRISDYEIFQDKILGQGGMGTVCRGRQISLGRDVAIKLLRPDSIDLPEFVQRFRREAELLAQVIDGNVVQVFGAGEWNGRQFYAMEFVPGDDLGARLRRGDRFTPEEVLRIAEGVARALRAAWRFRIIHRDIKPSNILISPDGTVKVADFGLAKSLRNDAAQSAAVAGTARYLSPEQGLGLATDVRSDIYSLGVVLFELATNRTPFEDEGITSLMFRHVHDEPPKPRAVDPTVPEPLERLILKCLAKQPGARYQNPEELLDGIAKTREELQAGAGASGRRRPRRLAILALVLLVAGVAAGAVAWRLFMAPMSDRERHAQAVEQAIGLGDYPEAMKLAELHFGLESPEYKRARERYREARFKEWESKAAQKIEERNWKEAVQAYEVMLEFADKARHPEASVGLEFCRDLQAATEAEAAEAWDRAIEIYRKRLAAPGALRPYLEQALNRAQAGQSKARHDKVDVARREGGKLLEEAVRLRKSRSWSEALGAIRRAREEFLKTGEVSAGVTSLVREMEAAANTPPGFIFVTTGPFLMGSEAGPEEERPRHTAETVAFYIGAREVTRAEYAKFLEAVRAKGHETCPADEPADKDHAPQGWSPDLPQNEPVTGIDWHDAAAYAKWAGGRLPTEGEWEKAAAFDSEADRSRVYSWGDAFDRQAKDISASGCSGMGSGPLEWTANVFEPYPGSSSRHADFGKGYRVLRGGVAAGDDSKSAARAARRIGKAPDQRDRSFGFRLVKDLP